MRFENRRSDSGCAGSSHRRSTGGRTRGLRTGRGQPERGPGTGRNGGFRPGHGRTDRVGDGAEGEKLPDLLKDFQAANPDVKITVTPIPWDAAHDKFTSAITAQKTPDVAMIGTTCMGEFAGLDALEPTPASIDKSKFLAGAQATTEVGGTSFGIPWHVETRLVYYRTDLAEKAGFSTPPTDWDGLEAMAKAIQDKAGAKWGINLQPGGTDSWQTVTGRLARPARDPGEVVPAFH